MTITISSIPGRLRLEHTALIRRKKDCEGLEQVISNMDGVQTVKINPRTGRILIAYSQSSSAKEEVCELLDCGSCLAKPALDFSRLFSFNIAEILVDLALHLTVPRPFDVLFPMALKAVK